MRITPVVFLTNKIHYEVLQFQTTNCAWSKRDMATQVTASQHAKRITGPRLNNPPRQLPESLLCQLVVRGQGEAISTVLREQGHDGRQGVVTPIFLLDDQGRITGSSVALSGVVRQGKYRGRQLWQSSPRNLTIQVHHIGSQIEICGS